MTDVISRAKFKIKILQFVYVPSKEVMNRYGWVINPNRCAAASLYGEVPMQCQREARYKAHGFGFCKQHAKQISPDLSEFEYDPSRMAKRNLIKMDEEKYNAEIARLVKIIEETKEDGQ